jgi:hypothetical protein
MAIPVLSHGSEIWAIYKEVKCKAITVKKHILCSVAQVSLLDQARSTDKRKELSNFIQSKKSDYFKQ